MSSPSGPRGWGRPSANGHAPESGAAPRRPSPRPGPAHDLEPPTEQVPVIDVPPGSPTQAVPLVGPFSDALLGSPGPMHRAAEPRTEAVPVIPNRRVLEPPTEAVPVIRREPEPPTAAVKVVPPDLFTQHLPPAAAATAVAEPEAEEGEKGDKKKRRLPIDIGPGALRRTWKASQPPTSVRRAFLAALLVPAVHIVNIVALLAFIALSFGGYSLGTVLGGNAIGIAGWLVAAVVAVWVGVQARAGRLWAAIALAVLAVAALVVTIDLALGTLTWIGLSGLPGVVRLVLLAVAALLCIAVPLLMIGPLRQGSFRQPDADS